MGRYEPSRSRSRSRGSITPKSPKEPEEYSPSKATRIPLNKHNFNSILPGYTATTFIRETHESEERSAEGIDCHGSVHDSPMKPRPDDSVHNNTSVSPFKRQQRPGGFNQNPNESDFKEHAFLVLQQF